MAPAGSELGFTLDTSHAALFRAFAAAYPTPFRLLSDEELDLARYVEELGPHAEVAHVSDALGVLGEGLPYGLGELHLDPVVARLAALVPYVVAEINEPDPARSGDMKKGYREVEKLAPRPEPLPARRADCGPTRSSGRPCSTVPTPCRRYSSSRSSLAAAAC